MIGVLVLAVAALVVVGLVVASRALDAAAWREGLAVYRVRFPRGVKAEQVASWLSALPPSSGVFGQAPVGVEVRATEAGIVHHLLLDGLRDGSPRPPRRPGVPTPTGKREAPEG